MTRTIAALAAGLAVALAPSAASAADFSFAGTFARDNDKAAYGFTLASAATVTLASLGYAGGIRSAGGTVASGGFDSLLSLYDATGLLVADNDDGLTAPADPATGNAYDAGLTLALGAGSYLLYLTQSSNYGPASLPGAFRYDAEPSFAGGFVDFNGNRRTNAFALDIRGVTSAATAAVPEPATWTSLLVGLGGIGGAMRYRRRRSTTIFA